MLARKAGPLSTRVWVMSQPKSLEHIYLKACTGCHGIRQSYFLITRNIILMRNLRIRSVVACLQLLQIPRLILKTPQLLMIKTPHDLAEVAQPENFEVSAEICVSYTNLLLLLSTRSSIHTWWVHCIMHGALLIPIELALCYGSRVSKAVIGCYVLADHFLVWCTPRWLQSLLYARLFTFGHYISLWVWS